MNLWLLKRIQKGSLINYDEAHAFVVRAASEPEARTLIGEDDVGDEGVMVWRDTVRSTCVPLDAEGESGIIISDFLVA